MPGFYKLMMKLRWAFMLLFTAIPWIIWSFLMWVYNVVFNSWLNKGWAEGNVYLLANTYFVFFQMLLSWPLFVEFPIYMRHMGMIRYISLFAAIAYNTVYFGLLFAWLYETYMESDTQLEDIGLMDIVLDFFFMYNTILHSSIASVNIGIILKEIELQFFEMFTSAGGKGSDYRMSMDFAKKSLYDDVWFLDPFRLTAWIWDLALGWHLSDLWDEDQANKPGENKKAYFLNWGK